MSDTLSLQVPADAGQLQRVHELIARLGCPGDRLGGADRSRFEGAVIELVGNVIAHATARAGQDSVTIGIEVSCRADALTALIRDNGEPVSVDLESSVMPHWTAEGGRGLALARRLSDELSYQQLEDANLWTVTCRRTS